MCEPDQSSASGHLRRPAWPHIGCVGEEVLNCDSPSPQSYQNLAAAAAELARDAEHSRSAAATPAKAAVAVHTQQQQQQQAAPRNSFQPFQAAAGGALRGAMPPTPGGPGGGRRTPLVSTPKFPPYNPMIHTRTSELPMPGTPASQQQHQQQRGGVDRGLHSSAGFGSRPSTSNPITHEMTFAAHGPSAGGRPGSSMGQRQPSASSAAQPWRQELSLLHEQQPWAEAAGPGDIGSERAQVLFVEPGSSRPGTGAGAGRPPGTGRGGGLAASSQAAGAIDPVAFAMTYPGRVRMTQWPPSSPYHTDDVEQDDLAQR